MENIISKHLTDPDSSIRERAKQILSKKPNPFFRCKNQISSNANQKISVYLKRKNGKRRTRLLSIQNIIWAIQTIQKRKNEIDVIHLHGGVVANSYGYPAKTTVALILKVYDYIFLSISTGNAKKGCTGYGRISSFLTSEEKRKDFIFNQAEIILNI